LFSQTTSSFHSGISVFWIIYVSYLGSTSRAQKEDLIDGAPFLIVSAESERGRVAYSP
jgi:hypothetical protein